MNAIQTAYSRIKQEIESGVRSQGDRLPSLTELAFLCGVSRTTMWKAVALLQKELLIHATPRGPIVVGPQGVHRSEQVSTGHLWKRLAERIGRDILANAFEHPTLPLIGKLSRHYHVDSRTLRKALDRLVAQGLLHVQGATYALKRFKHPLSESTILFISVAGKNKGIFLEEARSFSIIESLERECLQRGINTRTESFDQHDPSCLLAISMAVKRSENVAGFIVNIWNPWNQTLWQRWLDLLHFLVGRKVPVIVIDQAGNIAFPDSLMRHVRFRVLRIAGVRSGEMVADYLYRRGHKRLAFVTPFFNLEWAKARYEGVCRYFRSYADKSAKVEIFPLSEITDAFELTFAALNLSESDVRGLYHGRFSEEQIQGLLKVRDRVTKTDLGKNVNSLQLATTLNPLIGSLARLSKTRYHPQVLDTVQRMFLHLAGENVLSLYMQPSFETILGNSRATAWVCSDEKTALAAVTFLRSRGRRVPEDVAVIGFDNWIEAYEQQLSIYDFNMNGMVQAALLMIIDEKEFARKPTISEIEGHVIERSTTRK